MSLILTLGDDDKEFYKKQYLSLGELFEAINKALSEEEMTDGEPEPHLIWQEKTNYLIDMYNAASHFHKFERV